MSSPDPAWYCPVCGSGNFVFHKILWAELIRDWELSAEEVSYIDRQQGYACHDCGNNLRSMTLAKAILGHLKSHQTLQRTLGRFRYRNLRILEINHAGNLSPILDKLRNHLRITYPQGDMTHLLFEDDSWDLVVHSDTLEHVSDPRLGLQETCRVLRKGGACLFTAPIIIGRMSRSREGMASSYHGNPSHPLDDYKVVTEFGADVWTYVLEAGFQSCRFHHLDYPAGIAIEAVK